MVRAFTTIAIKNVLACGIISIWVAKMNEHQEPLLVLCMVAFRIGVRAYIRGVSAKLVY